MKCPECAGRGEIMAIACGRKGPVGLSLECELCEKTGKISKTKAAWRAAGRKMRDERIGRGVVLRNEAKRRGMDPVVLSKMERGILKPA